MPKTTNCQLLKEIDMLRFRLKRTFISFLSIVFVLSLIMTTLSSCNVIPAKMKTYTISESEIQDKILGGWVGQMTGVVLGYLDEFKYAGEIMPESAIRDFNTLNINHGFIEDDLWLDAMWIGEMVRSGYDTSLENLAQVYMKTPGRPDHANKKAYENLKAGIDPKEAGSYLHGYHGDCIDWQIEADFVGQVYSGLIQEAADRSFEIGHLICYGDGVYGGVFVSAMYAAAMTADSLDQVIKAGIDVIPNKTKYKNILLDVMEYYKDGKTWEECWNMLEKKWASTSRCLKYKNSAYNIDAKLNGAYVLMGLLWGNGNFAKTMEISMRCGQDSDCNASTAAGVLGKFIGYDAIPDIYKKGLDFDTTYFAYTQLSLNDILEGNMKLVRDLYTKKGFILNNNEWTINVSDSVKPVPFEQWPEDTGVWMTTKTEGADVFINLQFGSTKEIKSYSFNMGDGNVYEGKIALYNYSEPGTYTIKATITDIKGKKSQASSVVTVNQAKEPISVTEGVERNISAEGFIILSDTEPLGGGNRDIRTIRDGIKDISYETFVGPDGHLVDFYGYVFDKTYSVSSVRFIEGIHSTHGGWFAQGTMQLEALTDKGWVKVKSTISPEYPKGDTQKAFGANFETYTFSFKPIVCKGIRIIGDSGGSSRFTSIAELDVIGKES